MSGYGSTQPKYGKQQSLLSAPPQSKRTVKTPKVIESSSVPIVNTIHYLSKIIIYVYLVFLIVAIPITILMVADWNRLLLFVVLILGTMVLSLGGAFGIYKWGTVQMQIDRFKGENSRYESELMQLKTAKENISREVLGITDSVGKLKKNVDHLKENLHSYDQLRQDLESIAGDNQDLNEMINSINGMYDTMRTTVIQNQRSSILEIYYDVQFKDKDQGLSKKEYKRFKAKLDKETRTRFEKYGDFEQLSGVDNVIDLAEFQDLLGRILSDMEENLLK